MQPNTLKWPQFEQLGREFYDKLKPAIDQIASGAGKLDDEAQRDLAKLQSWLDAPCVATVKLDGTNLGVDDSGVMVGRNTEVTRGETYQKVDVWSLLEGYAEKAARLRTELSQVAGEETVAQVMLYGELVVNSKYNYSSAGIFKQWLCFGVAVRPGADDDEAASRLAVSLQVAGFNAKGGDGKVIVVPNAKLSALLEELQVCTVSEAYRPAGSITETQWKEHGGTGTLPQFQSLRHLLLSDWAYRFLLPADGVPLGEGLVVASGTNGKLFKWKHAGEELGKVPELLAEAVDALRGITASPQAGLLPEGLLHIFERLLLVATTKPAKPVAGNVVDKPDTKKNKGGSQGDNEAIAVWESALTKFDCLESCFERGEDAKRLMQAELIDQVASDLVKDYGVEEKGAQQRAKRVVLTEMGKRFGIWKKALSNASDP
jgi:hypothetical protein